MISPELFTLKNNNGMVLSLTDFGATLIGLQVPDRYGNPVDVIAGLKSEADYASKAYLDRGMLLGSTVGRYAGRISGGHLTIGGITYELPHKNGVHLHGGKRGFDKRFWTVVDVEGGEEPRISMTYLSPHLEAGHPGNLEVKATFGLTKANELHIVYEATTDHATHVNLTNHAYFNLDGGGTIVGHNLQLNADSYLEVGSQLIPSGRILPVSGTRYDFSEMSIIDSNFQPLDDTFIMNTNNPKAIISSPRSGIRMEVHSNQPAVVVFTPTAEQFSGFPFKENSDFGEVPAICFETQYYPDAPNNPHFPSTLLRPGDRYKNETRFVFTTG